MPACVAPAGSVLRHTPQGATLQLPKEQGPIDFVSDLHLHPGDPVTLGCALDYLEHTPAQAVFILGDLFEAWVGDDALIDPEDFEIRCQSALRDLAQRADVFFMHGNRDFLLGPAFAQSCGLQLLPDPCILSWNGLRMLLSHGDAWCSTDASYLAFRQQVRTPAWQINFLAKPLSQRRQLAQAMRAQSRQHQAQRDGGAVCDIDLDIAAQAMHHAQTQTLIHGHTHQPQDHTVQRAGQAEWSRSVLSDWDAQAQPVRAQVLRYGADGTAERINVMANAPSRAPINV
ncbi:MAG: UDP-2,3-diacylglucosamine diphosphatase [Rhodoferax sp.]